MILNSKLVRFFQGYRTMIFAPYVTSMVAAGFTFRLLLENKGGLFNVMLNTFKPQAEIFVSPPILISRNMSLDGYRYIIEFGVLKSLPEQSVDNLIAAEETLVTGHMAHFSRLFRREVGVSPSAYGRGRSTD